MKAPAHGQTMSVNDAAHQLGIGRSTLYRYIQRGNFPCIRIGNHVKVAQREIDERVRQGIVLAG